MEVKWIIILLKVQFFFFKAYSTTFRASIQRFYNTVLVKMKALNPFSTFDTIIITMRMEFLWNGYEGTQEASGMSQWKFGIGSQSATQWQVIGEEWTMCMPSIDEF
jgi:hypothetical protein